MHLQSYNQLNYIVFCDVLSKSPVTFSKEKGIIWGEGGTNKQKTRSLEVACTQGREAWTNIFFAPSLVKANALFPSLKLKPKSELTSFSVSLAWNRPKIRLKIKESVKTATNYPEKYAKLNRFIQRCLVGGFTGWRPRFIICLALPLIIHWLGWLSYHKLIQSPVSKKGGKNTKHHIYWFISNRMFFKRDRPVVLMNIPCFSFWIHSRRLMKNLVRGGEVLVECSTDSMGCLSKHIL